ncbi:hypothetical protein [Terrarubrum flagellatum]|uniref:hypothetical protein n=1 Tax=Terrirubrum flagellatum TaxID=2895980 RepID=UPI003144F297
MATEFELRMLVYRTLLSPSAAKIDFALGSIHVDGAGFAGVAALVAHGGIGIKVENQQTGEAASYNYPKNSLSFPLGYSGTSPDDREAIVHECTHALHDIWGGGRWWSERGSITTARTENEAAAYIAGALYLTYEAGSPVATPSTLPVIFQLAYDIAGRISGQKSARVDLRDEMRLRQAIANDPVYQKRGVKLWSLTVADGI